MTDRPMTRDELLDCTKNTDYEVEGQLFDWYAHALGQSGGSRGQLCSDAPTDCSHVVDAGGRNG